MLIPFSRVIGSKVCKAKLMNILWCKPQSKHCYSFSQSTEKTTVICYWCSAQTAPATNNCDLVLLAQYVICVRNEYRRFFVTSAEWLRIRNNPHLIYDEPYYRKGYELIVYTVLSGWRMCRKQIRLPQNACIAMRETWFLTQFWYITPWVHYGKRQNCVIVKNGDCSHARNTTRRRFAIS